MRLGTLLRCKQRAGGRTNYSSDSGRGIDAGAAWSQTLALGLVAGPVLSVAIAEVQPFDDVSLLSAAALFIVNVLFSVPTTVGLGAFVVLCSVTIYSPSFYERLVGLYDRALPDSLQEGKKSAVTAFLDKLDKVGLRQLVITDEGEQLQRQYHFHVLLP